MNSNKIIFRYVAFLVIFSIAIFFVGINETIRNESFSIVENSVWGNYSYDCVNKSQTTSECTNFNTSQFSNAYQNYEEFKTTYIYTNEPFIIFLNFMGLLGFFYLIGYSWKLGWSSPPMSLFEIFNKYGILMIFGVYLGGVVVEYLLDIFLNQLILVLFNEIYSSVYMYVLLTDWFIGIVLFSYILSWFANELKYFDVVNKP